MTRTKAIQYFLAFLSGAVVLGIISLFQSGMPGSPIAFVGRFLACGGGGVFFYAIFASRAFARFIISGGLTLMFAALLVVGASVNGWIAVIASAMVTWTLMISMERSRMVRMVACAGVATCLVFMLADYEMWIVPLQPRLVLDLVIAIAIGAAVGSAWGRIEDQAKVVGKRKQVVTESASWHRAIAGATMGVSVEEPRPRPMSAHNDR